MLWGRTGQKGFPRERLGRRPAVLGFYAWQYSGCPMKAGNLSESEGSDAFWVPLYSSIYLRESHVQGNRFDLENPGHYIPEQRDPLYDWWRAIMEGSKTDDP